jgi:hypothetical protein
MFAGSASVILAPHNFVVYCLYIHCHAPLAVSLSKPLDPITEES